MGVVKVPLDGLAERLGRDFAKIRPNLHQALFDAVQTRGVALAGIETQNAKPRPPVDRGTYIRSFAAAKVADGVWLYNSAPYAGVIEHGRRAGTARPPIDAIAAWVLRKGLAGNKPGRVTRVSPNTLKAARSIAFVIARKIGRDGTSPMKIVEKAVEKLMPYLKVEMAKAVAKALGGAE